VDTYRIYDGTDENGIVGTVAPGLFAQEGRCWRTYENPVGHEAAAGSIVWRRALTEFDAEYASCEGQESINGGIHKDHHCN
jgi:hypothetical protein